MHVLTVNMSGAGRSALPSSTGYKRDGSLLSELSVTDDVRGVKGRDLGLSGL